MSKLNFKSNISPTAAELTAVSNVTPLTPFNTGSYAAARRIIGYKPCTLVLEADSEVTEGCLGFFKKGILSSSLELMTSPKLSEPDIFWIGVLDFCRKERVCDLFIESFASETADIPWLPGEVSRRVRYEFILDLTSPELFQNISQDHKRDISCAQKSGLIVKKARELSAAKLHLGLVRASMAQQAVRSEGAGALNEKRFFEALLTSGSGEIFQVYHKDKVVSSIMLVKSKYYAYYQSGGTSEDGIQYGASVFCICEVATILKSEGIQLFNLGEADVNEEDLHRFKTGFGARPVKLEAVSISVGSPIKRKIRKVAKLTIRDPIGLIKLIIRDPLGNIKTLVENTLIKVERTLVFSVNPADISITNTNDKERHVEFRKINDEELARLSQQIEYRDYAERFRKLGLNPAYGLYVNGAIVHISYLVDEEMDKKLTVRKVKLRPGEMEITGASTDREYRNKGLFTLSIQHLCQIAAAKNIKQIFGITARDNIASQHAFKKAGFSKCGMIWRIFFPFAQTKFIILRRFRIN